MTDLVPVEVWAAPGRARTIVLTEIPPYPPGEAAGRAVDDRIEQDAADLWEALRTGLPVATLVQLREHFRTWRP
jgi:hypothetical protein